MGGPGSGRRPLAPCGTRAAYQRHRKRGEDCLICRQAATAHYRKKRGTRPRLPRQNRGVDPRILVVELKLARGGCEDCQRPITPENYFAFDLDHIDPKEKSFTVSASYKNVSIDTLRAEIAKCRLLCAFCHRLRTHRDRHHLLQVAKERRLIAPHPSFWEIPHD